VSIKLMSEVWGLDLTKIETLVLIALADHANDDAVCYPSRDRITWKTGLHRSTVSEIIKRLEARQIIRTLRKGNQFTQSSIYKLQLQNAPRKKPFVPKQLEAGQIGSHPEQLAVPTQNASRLSPKPEISPDSQPSESCPELYECRPEPECKSASTLADVGGDDSNRYEPSKTVMTRQESLPDQQSASRQADAPGRDSKPNKTATVVEGQIGGMRVVSAKGKQTKLLLTIGGRPCKVYGDAADRLRAKYKNGDYVHADGFLETCKFGEEYVLKGGYRIEPSPPPKPRQEPPPVPIPVEE